MDCIQKVAASFSLRLPFNFLIKKSPGEITHQGLFPYFAAIGSR
jgi:hypothetical protein